jgi:hypothetical protein
MIDLAMNIINLKLLMQIIEYIIKNTKLKAEKLIRYISVL